MLLLASCCRSTKVLHLIPPRGSHHEAQLPNWTTSDWPFGESPGWSDGILWSELSTTAQHEVISTLMVALLCREHWKKGDSHIYVCPVSQPPQGPQGPQGRLWSLTEVSLGSHRAMFLSALSSCLSQMKSSIIYVSKTLKFMDLCWLCGQEQRKNKLLHPGTEWLSAPFLLCYQARDLCGIWVKSAISEGTRLEHPNADEAEKKWPKN